MRYVGVETGAGSWKSHSEVSLWFGFMQYILAISPFLDNRELPVCVFCKSGWMEPVQAEGTDLSGDLESRNHRMDLKSAFFFFFFITQALNGIV